MLEVLKYPFDSVYILKKKKSIRKLLLQDGNLIEKKVAILSGSTIGEIKNVLEIFLMSHGIKPVFYESSYNRFYETAVFQSEELVAFQPDIVYIHTTSRNIDEFASTNAPEGKSNELIEKIFLKYKTVWESLEQKCQCPIIQNNFEMLPYRLMGNSDCYSMNGRLRFIATLNEKIGEYARLHDNFFINDIHYLSASYGLDKWHDEKLWYMYKYGMALEAIPSLCYNISNIIKSIYGKNKKGLVLDLDETLWGGIIGEEGKENIQLGTQTSKGEAYLDFQKYIKEIAGLGIVLNVCSKNEESTALEGLNHESSYLKQEDFICFKANWKSKSENINEIARDLNLLPDSLVFIDDSPMEREEVKTHISGIAVPEMGQVEDYIRQIDRNGYFEVTTISSDDIKRRNFYKENIKRNEMMKSFNDYNAYLKSVEMTCYLESVNENNIKRVTQLINKTNQFNFTTQRYTEAEVRMLNEKEDYEMLTGKLVDRLGDNGIVTTVFMKQEEEIGTLELWVMSCRVFKRNLEYIMLEEVIKCCRARGIQKLRGIYKETNKNKLISDFYEKLGFKVISCDEMQTTYEINIEDIKIKNEGVMRVLKND